MKKKDEIKRKYILPNFSFGTPGRLASLDENLKDSDQFMVLGTERFQVPELLFNPNDAMIRQVILVPLTGPSVTDDRFTSLFRWGWRTLYMNQYYDVILISNLFFIEILWLWEETLNLKIFVLAYWRE